MSFGEVVSVWVTHVRCFCSGTLYRFALGANYEHAHYDSRRDSDLSIWRFHPFQPGLLRWGSLRCSGGQHVVIEEYIDAL